MTCYWVAVLVLSFVVFCSGNEIITNHLEPGQETILDPGYEGYVDHIKITVSPVPLHSMDEELTVSLDGVWFSCSTGWSRAHHCDMKVDEDMAVMMPAPFINRGESALTAVIQFQQVDVPQTGNILLYLAGIAVIVFAFLLVYSVLSVCRRRQSNQPPTGIVISDAPAYGTSIPRVSGVVINADFYKEALEDSANHRVSTSDDDEASISQDADIAEDVALN